MVRQAEELSGQSRNPATRVSQVHRPSIEASCRYATLSSLSSTSDCFPELAAAAGEFAHTIAELSSSNEGLGQQLAGALAGLASVERKVQELQDNQANEDTLTIMSTGARYVWIFNVGG